jgi:hypothetical protein
MHKTVTRNLSKPLCFNISIHKESQILVIEIGVTGLWGS